MIGGGERPIPSFSASLVSGAVSSGWEKAGAGWEIPGTVVRRAREIERERCSATFCSGDFIRRRIPSSPCFRNKSHLVFLILKKEGTALHGSLSYTLCSFLRCGKTA